VTLQLRRQNTRDHQLLFSWNLILLQGPTHGIGTTQALLAAAQVIDLMARLAHGFEMFSVVALRFVAEVRYCNADFDLSSASSGSWPRHADFLTATLVF
jgi:hypothetical protein